MSEQPSTSPKEKKKLQLSEGVLLGTVPVVVYAFSFVYEMGYLSFYGLPSALISIDAPAMISAALFGALYIFALLFWLSLAIDSSDSEYNIVKTIGLLMLYFGFFPIIYLLLRGSEYLPIAFFLTVGVMFLIIVLRGAEKRWVWLQGFSAKAYCFFAEVFPSESVHKKKKSTFELLQDGAGIVFIVLIPFVLVFAAGRHNAENLTTYDVFENEKLGVLAVARIYGNIVVSIPFDKGQMSFKREYAVFKFDNLSGVVFSSEKIGPLKTIPSQNGNKNPNK